MGYGSYSASDWTKLKKSRQLSPDREVKEVFKRTSCDPKLDTRFIGTRECFDSDDHPSSTPIVVGLDVTGSMGYLAVEIATGALNDLIMKLYSTGAVKDPALMCAAYGDYKDAAALQVTQFESDIRVAEQLLDIYFENKGWGQVVPTCLWAFLSRHTNIDAVRKRGEKGFVFTLGDRAEIRSDHVPETIETVVGDRIPGATRESILAEVQQKFHVFHIMLGSEGNAGFLNGHKIVMAKTDIKCIPEVILSTIQMQRGMRKAEILAQWDEIKRPVIDAAISQLSIIPDGRAVSL